MFRRGLIIGSVMIVSFWTGKAWSWAAPGAAGLRSIEFAGIHLAWERIESEVRVGPGVGEAPHYELRLIASREKKPGTSLPEILDTAGLVGFDAEPGVTQVEAEGPEWSMTVENIVRSPAPVPSSGRTVWGNVGGASR